MKQLSEKSCASCAGAESALKGVDLEKLQDQLGGSWDLVREHHLEKSFAFPDFVQALALTNKIGELAEKEKHHPDIHLSWGKVRVTIWTHKVKGLTEADFVLAAKIDKL